MYLHPVFCPGFIVHAPCPLFGFMPMNFFFGFRLHMTCPWFSTAHGFQKYTFNVFSTCEEHVRIHVQFVLCSVSMHPHFPLTCILFPWFHCMVSLYMHPVFCSVSCPCILSLVFDCTWPVLGSPQHMDTRSICSMYSAHVRKMFIGAHMGT